MPPPSSSIPRPAAPAVMAAARAPLPGAACRARLLPHHTATSPARPPPPAFPPRPRPPCSRWTPCLRGVPRWMVGQAPRRAAGRTPPLSLARRRAGSSSRCRPPRRLPSLRGPHPPPPRPPTTRPRARASRPSLMMRSSLVVWVDRRRRRRRCNHRPHPHTLRLPRPGRCRRDLPSRPHPRPGPSPPHLPPSHPWC